MPPSNAKRISVDEYNATLKLKTQDGRQRARVRSGAATEDFVEQLNRQCEDAGIARIRKLATPWRVVGKTRRGVECVPERKSGTDYFGHMIGTGRAVYVEAKRLTEARFNFASRLPEHQREALNVAHADGALAILLIVDNKHDVAVIPWSNVRDRISDGDKSIRPIDLAFWFVPRKHPYLIGWAQ